MKQARRFAWVLILIVDLGYIAWGAMAAAMPDGLLGPGGKAILPAGYEGACAAERAELAEDGFNAELAEYSEENT